ncbi:hypothetical protein, partial [Xenorhabdus lircayensis]
MAGLPVGLSDSGGTWAMGGLSDRVPVKPVQAAQSPLNIMQGDCAHLTAGQGCEPKPPAAVRCAQSALCRRPR